MELDAIEKPLQLVSKDQHTEQPIDELKEPLGTTNIETPVKTSPSLVARLLGIFYILLSAFIFTSSVFVTKKLKVDTLNALIPCYSIHCTMLLIYSKVIKRYTLFHKKEKMELFFLFINVFFSSTGILSFYFAYRYLPLPDLITIRYTQVIWTAVIVTVLYREKPSIVMIVSILLTVIGVTCVAQPSFLFQSTVQNTKVPNNSYQRLLGILIVFYSSIALSIMIVSNKHLISKYKTKYCLIMISYAVVTLVVLIFKVAYTYNFFLNGTQAFKHEFFNQNYLYAASICVLHIVAIILTQKAIKLEHPSIFTIVQSSNILFSILLQNVFSSEKSNFISIVGSTLVLASIIIITGWKLLKEKSQNKT